MRRSYYATGSDFPKRPPLMHRPQCHPDAMAFSDQRDPGMPGDSGEAGGPDDRIASENTGEVGTVTIFRRASGRYAFDFTRQGRRYTASGFRSKQEATDAEAIRKGRVMDARLAKEYG